MASSGELSVAQIDEDGDMILKDEQSDADGDGKENQPSPKHKGKKKGKAKSSPKAKAKGAAKMRTDRVCLICQSASQPTYGNNPYCKECKNSVDGLKRDAQKGGWIQQYNEAKQNPQHFRKLVRDFINTCPPMGNGVARAKYSSSRLQHFMEKSLRNQEGSKALRMDWFDFEIHYQKKKLSTKDCPSEPCMC